MNTPVDFLPSCCDVLIVGAGPAGSAAAITLAKAGLDVVLVDQHAFPRDKVCGDGLIPDAHQALAKLGVLAEVMQQAQQVSHLSCTSPRGKQIDIESTLAVLPRKQLDDIVCKAAVLAGARMFAPLRFSQLIEEDGQVIGATLSHGTHTKNIRASWVILATGAVPAALTAASMLNRQSPSAIALRCYIKNEAMTHQITKLEVIFHKSLAPGYGWIFPCGNGLFNVGVGVCNTGGGLFGQRPTARSKVADTNLRDMFDKLSELSESAHKLIQGGEQLGPLKGAPLRCTLEGAQLSRPGLIVTGEAAGSTYALTGEGIGKAMETGMLAAEAILLGPTLDDTQVRAHYQDQIDALRPRFKLYERAQIFNIYPWLADVVIWRAQKSARLRQRLSGVLNETSNPGHLFTLKGLVRLFTH
jgi:geranylgeranyl reductase family protein